jgi:exodeoxyribonuclease VII small subunit
MTDTDDLSALTYEELVEKLEELTRRIAAGEVGIEEASELYERAGVIHHLAAERLAQVKARIERLDGS